MTRPFQLGDLQHAILRALWARDEATVTEVRAALGSTRAPTTIATMLKKMEARGLVEHRAEGRQVIYRPLVSEAEVRRSLVGELCRRLFDGDANSLMAHLVHEREIDAADLEVLQKRIADAGDGGLRQGGEDGDVR